MKRIHLGFLIVVDHPYHELARDLELGRGMRLLELMHWWIHRWPG